MQSDPTGKCGNQAKDDIKQFMDNHLILNLQP